MWKQRESSSRQLPIRFYTVLLDPVSFVLPGVWDACLGYRWGYRGIVNVPSPGSIQDICVAMDANVSLLRAKST